MESATLHQRRGARRARLFASLEDVREFAAVLLVRLREDPAGDHLFDAGLEGPERGRPVDPDALDAARDADREADDDLAVREVAVAQERALVAGLDADLVVVDDARDVALAGRGTIRDRGRLRDVAAARLSEARR